MTLPTAAEILSFYLYGSKTPPATKAKADLINRSDLTTEYPDTILFSEFMSALNGPGRFANPATLGLDRGAPTVLDKFFRGELDLGTGTHTLDEAIAPQALGFVDKA